MSRRTHKITDADRCEATSTRTGRQCFEARVRGFRACMSHIRMGYIPFALDATDEKQEARMRRVKGDQ